MAPKKKKAAATTNQAAAAAASQAASDKLKYMVRQSGIQQLQTMHTRTVKTQTNVEETKRLL
jgi:hypothetical protein